MRVVLQHVSEARVEVDGRVVGKIGFGHVLLVAIAADDTEAELAWMAEKVLDLRVCRDEEGKLNRSLRDLGLGELLVVSQFTLYGDCRKGRRPSYIKSAPPELAEPMCKKFAQMLRERGFNVAEGVFGAHMHLSLVNDGPVTLILEREHGR
ncbi:MAG TPA: D-aminoacyl-tRNA deacylase [bacterium]|nr:D-aminoacyl-tRNA deacylase [bacterium]